MRNKIKYIQEPEKGRFDSFWFDGQVATVSKGEKTVSIEATGHVQVSFDDKNFDMPEMAFDNKSARKEAKVRGYTDRKLKSFVWENNNWFSFYINRKSGWEQVPDVTAVDLNEALTVANEILNEWDSQIYLKTV